jgi:hypothetical protein
MNAATLTELQRQHAAPREAALPQVAPGFGSLQSFELMQRAARLLSVSTLVPAAYRAKIDKTDRYGNINDSRDNPNALANCVVALNMSQRMGADPLMVMQNLYIVEGRPSWSSQWIIAAINGCGRFSPLRFDLKPLGKKKVEYTTFDWRTNENGKRERTTNKQVVEIDDVECVAWALEKGSDTRLESPPVSISLAVKEGWYSKNGSKWQTMPEVMLRYRTASFFGKLYAPELLMGLQTVEEMQDIVIDATPDGKGGYAVDVETLKAAAKAEAVDTETGEILDAEQDAALREVETRRAEESPAAPEDADAPGFEDAIAAVKRGDHDLARDIARALPEGQKKAVDNAKTERPERQRGNLNLE